MCVCVCDKVSSISFQHSSYCHKVSGQVCCYHQPELDLSVKMVDEIVRDRNASVAATSVLAMSTRHCSVSQNTILPLEPIKNSKHCRVLIS